jgi:VanZ family protein
MSSQRHKWKYAAAWTAIGCALIGGIVYLSLIPNPPPLPGNGDKYGHIAGYAILMFWFMQAYRGRRSRVLIAIALAVLGVGLEFVQGYTGYRNFERGDMLADGIGIALGWLAGPPRTLNLLERIEKSD